MLPAAHCMVFSTDSTHLIAAGPGGLIWVVDFKSMELVHTLHIPSHDDCKGWANGLVKVMCTSPDGHWLASASNTGHIAVFNLDDWSHHWTVPVFHGTSATAMLFLPSKSSVLIMSSAANQIHDLDVEMKAPGEWSKLSGARVAKTLVDFPGSIIGLSLSTLPTSTSIIAYSPSAMCHIDLSQPIGDEMDEMPVDSIEYGPKALVNGHKYVISSGNGLGNGNILKGSCRSSDGRENRLAVSISKRESKSVNGVNMKNPVLFMGHIGPEFLVIVEKPWLAAMRQFPAPVSRHIYGS